VGTLVDVWTDGMSVTPVQKYTAMVRLSRKDVCSDGLITEKGQPDWQLGFHHDSL
jgi:hypothetical protein